MNVIEPANWPTIEITTECLNALKAARDPRKTFKQTAVALGPNRWRIKISPDVFAALEAAKLEGETYSDCIMRKFATQNGVN